jgi:hypothetical protein
MRRGIVRFLQQHSVALLALFVALGGTSMAATQLAKNSVGTKQLKKNAVTNPKIKNGAVTGAKIANNSVTGADVRESSLGTVPNASAVGGATVDTLTVGRSTAATTGGGTSSSCDPATTAFVDCGTVSLSLPREGRVLIVADAAFDGANSFGYRGDCKLTVDATQIGASVAAGTVAVGAGLTGPGYNANTQDGIGLNAVTGSLSAGAHAFALQCNQAGGSVEFPETFVSAVMLGSG